jgi:hypothetical protein
MIADERLAAAMDALIGPDGPLPFRLNLAAIELAQLRPTDFDYPALRQRFVELRKAFVLLGFVQADGADEQAWQTLSREDAMALALRLIEFVYVFSVWEEAEYG